MLDRGDVNLTFKRYLADAVRLPIADDHVTDVIGDSPDAELMRGHFAAWGDRAAYAVSHVGWGLNRRARWDAMAFYDKSDFNGTELRAFAGNFLYSTGANEVAGRHTRGAFRSAAARLHGRARWAGGRHRGAAGLNAATPTATLVLDAPLAHQRWGDIGNSARVAVLLHGVGGGRESWGDALSGTGRALAEAGLCARGGRSAGLWPLAAVGALRHGGPGAAGAGR